MKTDLGEINNHLIEAEKRTRFSLAHTIAAKGSMAFVFLRYKEAIDFWQQALDIVDSIEGGRKRYDLHCHEWYSKKVRASQLLHAELTSNAEHERLTATPPTSPTS